MGGREEYDGRWNAVAYLFKGGASGDGKAAFNYLLPSRFSEMQGAMLGPLMEGWASSDLEGAWAMVTSSPELENGMENARGQSLEGFFRGLPRSTDWERMRVRVEDGVASGPLFEETLERVELRRGLAKAWVQNDPEAALAWFAPHASDARSDGEARFSDPIVLSYSDVLYNWLQEDPEGSTNWLATWKPDQVPRQEIFKRLDEKANHYRRVDHERSERMREALSGLLEEKEE